MVLYSSGLVFSLCCHPFTTADMTCFRLIRLEYGGTYGDMVTARSQPNLIVQPIVPNLKTRSVKLRITNHASGSIFISLLCSPEYSPRGHSYPLLFRKFIPNRQNTQFMIKVAARMQYFLSLPHDNGKKSTGTFCT